MHQLMMHSMQSEHTIEEDSTWSEADAGGVRAAYDAHGASHAVMNAAEAQARRENVQTRKQNVSSKLLLDKLQQTSGWSPSGRHLIPGTSTINAVCGGTNTVIGDFFVSGGANKCVTIRSLDQSNNMRILFSISCSSVVTAISVSQDGSTLAYGMRTGMVLFRDLTRKCAGGQQLPTRPSGSIVALWLSPDALRLVISTAESVETWGRGEWRRNRRQKTFQRMVSRRVLSQDQEHDRTMWRQLHKFATQTSFTSRFIGQHSLCGVRIGAEAEIRWRQRGGSMYLPEEGDFLMASGSRNSVVLWSLESGQMMAELSDLDQGCNCVWLSPSGTLLATAGASSRIMVWGLPDLELIFDFSAAKRVWALWGNSRILASAGADSCITLRSIETGAVLAALPRPGPVYALWGPIIADSERTINGNIRDPLIVSGGKSTNNTDSQPAGKSQGSSLVVRYLKSKQVLFQLGREDAAGVTKCLWTDGRLLVWGGPGFVTAVGKN